jgi:carboxymethylenebutenolidase
MSAPSLRAPIDPAILALYDEYTHAPLPRRLFLERLTRLAGGAAATVALLPLLENDHAAAAIVPPDDKALEVETLKIPGAEPLAGYRARPRKAGKAPAVVVIHENRGLNAYIEDVTRRLAAAGFLALAPDLLSRSGGTPQDEDQAREKIGALDPAAATADLKAIVHWLKTDSHATGKVGAVGFCWGGGMVNRLAVQEPGLDAGVVFYGMSPAPEVVGSIRARLLLHYAGLDDRINQGVPAYEAALKAAGKDVRLYTYPGVQHAFHNDTNAARYDAAAAKLAWDRTIAFLAESLR